MALMDITVIPLDKGEGSFSSFVADLQRLLAESGCNYRLHDMGTTIEGDVAVLFDVAQKLHDYAFTQGGKRVYTVIKVDDRRDKTVQLGDKCASVQAKIAPAEPL